MSGIWQELGDRIYRRRYASLDLNIGLIVGEDAAAVIDSRAHYGQADELIGDVFSLTQLPVTTLINTHYHWDHTFGNARFAQATIVGHHRTREVLLERGEEMKAQLVEAPWMPDETKPWMRAVEISPPGVTFDKTRQLNVGGRVVDLHHFGLGHTDCDIVASIDGVVFAGDLVEEGAAPSFGDAYPMAWPGTIDRLLPLLSGTVVPGHGDLVDRDFVAGQRDEIAAAAAAAASGDVETGPYPPDVMAVIASRLPRIEV